MSRLKKLIERLKALYHWADRRSGGLLGIVKNTLDHFSQARAPEAAAGLAYYTFFSLFPLLLFLVAAGSFILESEQAYEVVVGFVTQLLPTSRSLIENNVQNVLEARGTIGLIGLVGLLWSGLGAFTILGVHVNRAWPGAEARNFVESRLVALGMVGLLVLLLLLSLATTTLGSLLPRLERRLLGADVLSQAGLWSVLSRLISWLFAFLMFLSLYHWVPNVDVPWPAAVWSALVAALAWILVTNGFAWFLSSGLARYELVYGSLGTVVALLFWIYLSGWIALFGAHLGSNIAHRRGTDHDHDEVAADNGGQQ